jgi:alpha-tubulin suppressor-like RCC1 family protein
MVMGMVIVLGQLGQNDTTQCLITSTNTRNTWSSISGGNNHSLATKTDNTLWSWGLVVMDN